MEVTEAIEIAKAYVGKVFADEQISNLGLEETERDADARRWYITLGFSRPWNSPRTRAQEVLESLGAAPSLRRTLKTVCVSDVDGQVIWLKNPARAEAAE